VKHIIKCEILLHQTFQMQKHIAQSFLNRTIVNIKEIREFKSSLSSLVGVIPNQIK